MMPCSGWPGGLVLKDVLCSVCWPKHFVQNINPTKTAPPSPPQQMTCIPLSTTNARQNPL
jgi:hypothetical protein